MTKTTPDSNPARPLARATINLIPRAVDAIDQACLCTGGSKTDTINRALVVYHLMLDLLEYSDGSLTVKTNDGIERVHLI